MSVLLIQFINPLIIKCLHKFVRSFDPEFKLIYLFAMHFKNNHPPAQHKPQLSNTSSLSFYERNLEHYYTLGMHPLSIQQSLIAAANAEGKGKWSAHQHSLYIQFLSRNIQEMSDSLSRKANKVFLNMSRVITTRTADQCRSHHQKILKYHSSLQDIIARYQRKINGEMHYKKKQQWTRADEEGIEGFYTLKRVDNAFRLTILQSAVESFQL